MATASLPFADRRVPHRGEKNPFLETVEGAELTSDSGLRQTAAAFGSPPLDWGTLRTFIFITAEDMSAAMTLVAKTLELEPDDLVAYPANVFT
ncbi:MAG TPA: hypothetical protein VE401_08350 [Solirubrobacterales bacterium]|nr:hypothetical protein [Solirubrobacterales bacterium]